LNLLEVENDGCSGNSTHLSSYFYFSERILTSDKLLSLFCTKSKLQISDNDKKVFHIPNLISYSQKRKKRTKSFVQSKLELEKEIMIYQKSIEKTIQH
jgi:hypothetical protein